MRIKANNASNLLFILLGVYLAFAIIQSVLGYFLLKTSLWEETLFLSIPNRECRKLQKKCLEFLAGAKVFLRRS